MIMLNETLSTKKEIQMSVDNFKLPDTPQGVQGRKRRSKNFVYISVAIPIAKFEKFKSLFPQMGAVSSITRRLFISFVERTEANRKN